MNDTIAAATPRYGRNAPAEVPPVLRENVASTEMPRDIHVNTVLNGWTVQAGCQTAVFTDRNLMADEIARYIKNPGEVTQEYFDKRDSLR